MVCISHHDSGIRGLIPLCLHMGLRDPDEYTEKRGGNRSRSRTDDGARPKRRYQRRAKSPTERGFDENGFPLTANGERDRRYKSGKFAGRRPTALSRRPYGSGVADRRERDARSGSRGEMTRSEEREDREQRQQDAEEEHGDNTDDYEEEAEVMGRNGQVERGRQEISKGASNEEDKKEEVESEYPDPEADEEERREALEKRERLVRETMEREMSMNF